MKQITLVSLYGQKEEPLADMIRGCFSVLQKSPIGRLFRPYDLSQVHGTLAGMEKLSGYSQCYNANIWASHGKKISMDFSQLTPTLSRFLPMTVQFGGYSRTFNDFNSFGQSAYERSFQIQWATNRVTLIGWPHRNGDFNNDSNLQNMRSALAKQCQINHKYSNDNDLFMAIGEIAPYQLLSTAEKNWLYKVATDVENEARDFIADNRVNVCLDFDNVSIAQYQLKTLCPRTTIQHPVANPNLDSRFICSLYR